MPPSTIRALFSICTWSPTGPAGPSAQASAPVCFQPWFPMAAFPLSRYLWTPLQPGPRCGPCSSSSEKVSPFPETLSTSSRINGAWLSATASTSLDCVLLASGSLQLKFARCCHSCLGLLVSNLFLPILGRLFFRAVLVSQQE